MGEADSRFGALAEMVRQARLSRGMTQRQLSRRLKMSEGYVGHLESGRIRPNVETLKALAASLGLLYGQLAVAAGYITRQEFESPIDERQLARLSEVDDFSAEEWESVMDFARYLRSRRRTEG